MCTFAQIVIMFGKIQEAKKKAAAIKERLESISLMAESENGLARTVVNGNRKVISIEFLKEGDKQALAGAALEAVNKALEQADNVAESEMKAVAGDLLPGGLGNLFNS